MRKKIDSGSATEKMAAYSRAVVDDRWVFVSGTIGIDPATGLLPEDARSQAENAFSIIEAALAQADSTLKDVVRCRVFMTRRDDLAAVMEVLRGKFSGILPANTTVICELPHPNARVEIEVTAIRG